jgi:anaerobic magnesium-protoporphyrin IX monomethyl ester cyclase
MKTLLVSPPEQHMLMDAGDRPPLGLLYLAGALYEAGESVGISDLNHDSYQTFYKKVDNFKPDFIGVTTSTPYKEWFTQFFRTLKSRYPEVKTIAGGPHATVDSTLDVDYIVQGEGERAILDVVNNQINPGTISNYKCVRYSLEKEIDRLPMPAWDLLDVSKYGIQMDGKRTAPILSSRACPEPCFFCSKAVFGGVQRNHSIGRIEQELGKLNGFGFDSFYFIDDCFTYDEVRLKQFNDMMKEKKFGQFRITSRTDKVNRKMMGELKEAGISSISYGMEHMNNEVLELMNKNNNVASNTEAVDIANEFEVPIRGSFVMNLPGATKQSMYQCLEFALDKKLASADFYPLVAYPGTKLWINPERYGVKVDKDLNVYQTSGKTNVDIPGMSRHQVEEIIKDIQTIWRNR